MKPSKGLLASLFHASSNTRHWQAVKQMMERDIGSPIAAHFPIRGGDVLAFFKDRVLVWDGTSEEGRGGERHLSNATEPVGRGRTAPEAVIDLFDQLSTLDPEYSITKIISYSLSGQFGFKSMNLKFEKGLFVQTPGIISSHAQLPKRDKDVLNALTEQSAFFSEGAKPNSTLS